jgi:endonuclease YncB( thermonuclease family)
MGCPARLKKASLVGAFFVLVFYLAPAQALCPAPGAVPWHKVQRAVDGDTLRLADGRSVRLIGLDTPELGRNGKPAEPFAKAAQQRLQALLAVSAGQVQLVLGEQPKDRYGRTLAHAYDRQGHNLEAQLLAEGLGRFVAIAPNVALVDCHRAAERQARQARLGLWRQTPVLQAGQLVRGGFTLVQGQVQRVERNRGGLWLEMGDALVLQVAPKHLQDSELVRLQGLAGRRVEARGWVVDRSRRGALRPGQARWLLPLTHASMLEVLP